MPSKTKVKLNQPFLGAREFATEIYGCSINALYVRKHKNPASLPPPFSTRPLRWRRATVEAWVAQREAQNAVSINK